MKRSILESLKSRRSYYALGDDCNLSQEQIEQMVYDAATHAPSAYNSQSTRLVLLFGEYHHRLWEIVKETLKAIISEEAYAQTEKKINQSFAGGFGTVLFYEDQDVVAGLQKKFPSYAANFPTFSEHTSAMHQLALWMMFEDEGMGASLQHYNPLIDEAVREEYDLPQNWKLVAQMPFGKPLDTPGDKSCLPLDEKVKVYK